MYAHEKLVPQSKKKIPNTPWEKLFGGIAKNLAYSHTFPREKAAATNVDFTIAWKGVSLIPFFLSLKNRSHKHAINICFQTHLNVSQSNPTRIVMGCG